MCILIMNGTIGDECEVTKYVSINTEEIRDREKPGTTVEHELIRLINTNMSGFDRIESIIVSAGGRVISKVIDVNGKDVRDIAVAVESISNAIFRHCGPRDLDKKCEKLIQELMNNGCSFDGIVDAIIEHGYDKWFAEMWVDAARMTRMDSALPEYPSGC